MNKLAKITAGVLSLALAAGTIGNYAPLKLSKPTIASAEEGVYYGDTEYEVELKNVYIASIEENSDYSKEVDIIFPEWDNYYVSHNYIRLCFRNPNPYSHYDHDDYYENDEYAICNKKWQKTCNLFDKLTEGDIVTLKVASFYEDDAERLRNYAEKRDHDSWDRYFSMDIITGLRSFTAHYYGDINDDAVIDCYDVITYRKQLAGNTTEKLTEAQFVNGDVNFNDKIDEEDLRQVQDFLLGNATSFNNAAEIGSIRLDNTVDIKASEGKTADEKFAGAEMNFGVELLKKSFDPVSSEKNILISPLSLSTALAMTANGADGKTKDEMEKVLGNGLTIDEINEYMANYLSNLPDEKKEKLYIADSIWFKDKKVFDVNESFLEKNKAYYNAQIFKSKFDDSTVRDVNSWVNQNTKSMIPKLLENGSLTPDEKNEVLMMLINTLYFEDEWANPYTESTDGIFTDLDGKKHPIKRMDSKEYQYFDLGDADAFKKNYLDGNYSFVGIMPKEKNIVDYVNDLDADKLMEGLKTYAPPSTVDLYVMIPKFKYNYSKSMVDVLQAIGMNDLFDQNKCDLTKLGSYDNGSINLFVNEVLHKTKIEVNEKGTKAAAASAVLVSIASPPPMEKKEVHIELDRPFVYMIVDKNNIPLFIGAVTQISEE